MIQTPRSYLPPRQPTPPVQRIKKWALIAVTTVSIALALYLFFRGTKPRQVSFSQGASNTTTMATTTEGWVNGLPDEPVATEPPVRPVFVDEQARRELKRLQDLQRERDEAMNKQMEEIRRLLQSKPEPAAEKPKRTRAKAIHVVNEAKPPAMSGVPLYTLAVWDYIPCMLEPVLNSEVPGGFTVKITRPVLDATRTQILIPQGQRAGAIADTANLLPGNERIPTWGLSISLPNGQPLELQHAQITDAAGTNGLTGEVNNHIWRLVWTSVLVEGIQAGQQILTQEIANQNSDITISGVGQHSSNIARQRLGRAQDTRPTIIAAAGDLCNIRIPKAMELPSFAAVQR